MITAIKIKITQIRTSSGFICVISFKNLCNQVIAGFFSNNYLKVILTIFWRRRQFNDLKYNFLGSAFGSVRVIARSRGDEAILKRIASP